MIQLESVQSELMRRRAAADNVDSQSASDLQLLQDQVVSLERQLQMARQEIEQLSNHVKVIRLFLEPQTHTRPV